MLTCLFALLTATSIFATTRIEGGISYSLKPIVDAIPAYGAETDMNSSIYGHLQHGFLDMSIHAGADLFSPKNEKFSSADFLGYDFKGVWAIPMVGIGYDFDKLFDDFVLRVSANIGPDIRMKGGMQLNKQKFRDMLRNSKLHYQIQTNLYFKKLPFSINAFAFFESKGKFKNITNFNNWNKLAFSERIVLGASITIVLDSNTKASRSSDGFRYVIIEPAKEVVL